MVLVDGGCSEVAGVELDSSLVRNVRMDGVAVDEDEDEAVFALLLMLLLLLLLLLVLLLEVIVLLVVAAEPVPPVRTENLVSVEAR